MLLGALPPGRNVEQHDYFFSIAESLSDLLPDMKAFWPDAGKTLHIDGWREVTKVDNYAITVMSENGEAPEQPDKLFFLNLGGYSSGKLEEQHYTVLTVQQNKMQAALAAKQSVFFKSNTLKGIAASHIDEKYGIDVDEVYQIEDVLPADVKNKFRIEIGDGSELSEDIVHLGDIKLGKLTKFL